MTADISDERQEFLSAISNDTWVDSIGDVSDEEFDELKGDWTMKTIDFLESSTSQAELCFFVQNYNWDKGYPFLEELLANPSVDRATALTVFWMAEPAFYQAFPSRDELPEWAHDGWDFVNGLLRRLISGRYATVVGRFDAQEFVPESVNGPDCKWLIPAELCCSVEP